MLLFEITLKKHGREVAYLFRIYQQQNFKTLY